MFLSVQEEDEKERLSQAKEASEDEVTEHAEVMEDSLLGLSIEEVTMSLTDTWLKTPNLKTKDYRRYSRITMNGGKCSAYYSHCSKWSPAF